MIIDQIQNAGLSSYFQDPGSPGDINLGPIAPVRVRTAPLTKGKQMNISGIRFMMEGNDLRDLFRHQFDTSGASPVPDPIMRITVMKEMFPGLFSDPFHHRVYNVSGFADFNEGSFVHCKALEIDGVPTIVSTGNTKCSWTSKKYKLPDRVSIASVSWELAASRLAGLDNFRYDLTIQCWDENENLLSPIQIGQNINPGAKRMAEQINAGDISSFQIEFSAYVKYDAFIKERHLPVLTENLGTPLLRAVNILESVPSMYEIYSLTELESLCSEFRMSETPGPEITRITGTLDMNAILVYSENQFIHPDNDPSNAAFDIYDSNSRYEFVELELTPAFNLFEAKLVSETYLKPIL